jgi:Mrp family chromosome partitioning ATPase
MLIRELAKVAALKLNKSVLLLDANPSRTRHSEFFNIRSKWHWNEAVKDGDLINRELRPIGQSSLYVVQVLMDAESAASIDIDERNNALFEELKQMFDLILIDYPPPTSYPEGFMLTSKVDGVVMVLDAGKTRWQVAEQLKERIYSRGGHILGVVLNNRSYPIPQYVYDKL